MGNWPKEANSPWAKGLVLRSHPFPPRRQAPLGPAWGFVTLTLWCWGVGPLQRGLISARTPLSPPSFMSLLLLTERTERTHRVLGSQVGRGHGMVAPALTLSEDLCRWPACPSYLPNKVV